MSEPLRASFHQNTLFLKTIVSAKLKSYISVFGILIKLIWVNMTLFFQIYHVNCLIWFEKRQFFQILDSVKDTYMFQKAHERIKDCLLIYHFVSSNVPQSNKLSPWKSKTLKHVFWLHYWGSQIHQLYNIRQQPNLYLLSFRHSQMFWHIYGILFRNLQGRRGFVVFLECFKTFLSVQNSIDHK